MTDTDPGPNFDISPSTDGDRYPFGSEGSDRGGDSSGAGSAGYQTVSGGSRSSADNRGSPSFKELKERDERRRGPGGWPAGSEDLDPHPGAPDGPAVGVCVTDLDLT